jgi:transposase-like protein
MVELTINEAAQKLGLSPNTIRRRLHSGELIGFQRETPQGYTWVIQLEEEMLANAKSSGNDEALNNCRETIRAQQETIGILLDEVSHLRSQIDNRGREVQELHVLLQQAQKALPVPQNGHDKNGASASWWRRMLKRG